MGMAASQARYLALVARKSNCEYEGQQINQSRLILSNQSAELFNQMMGLEVPSPPSKSDYTYKQYSYTDGLNTYTIDKWNQLAENVGDGYNYVVTYHYNSNQYKGYTKNKLDPQVQYSISMPTGAMDPNDQIKEIQAALVALNEAKAAAELARDAYTTAKIQAGKISQYIDKTTINKISSCEYSEADLKYTITANGQTYEYVQLDNATIASGCGTIEELKKRIDKLVEYGALTESQVGDDYSNIYYNAATDSIALKEEIDAIKPSGSDSARTLPIYHNTDTFVTEGASYTSIKSQMDNVDALLQTYTDAQDVVEEKQAEYEKCNVPKYIGNLGLTPLATLDKNQAAAITQIIKDMKDSEIKTYLTNCFNTLDGTYDATTYTGGLYTFDQASTTYYTTYYDLYNSAISGTGINKIDDQQKLPYYGAQDMEQPVTKTSRALIEVDKSGRFTSIRFEDDSIVYTLETETATDEVAYDDAMNQYNYEKSLYDKKVSDINAKTSIIQRQDQNLELRLKQLDTEQNALSTEIDAVAKVVKDNVEKSFKTFGS